MYQPIIGTLGYVLSKDRSKVLLVHRNRRKEDQHLGKYNGVGGKMLEGEDVLSCMKREILEEVGIHCLDLHLRGTVNWPGFGPNGECWLGFVFLIDRFSGEPYTSNEEGDLEWKSIAEMDSLPMWDGDRYFLPLVFDNNPALFHAFIPYKDGKVVSFSYSRN